MSVSDEIFEDFFSKAAKQGKVPDAVLQSLRAYQADVKQPTQEALIAIISTSANQASDKNDRQN